MQALIASKKVKDIKLIKNVSAVLRAQIQLALAIKRTRDQLALNERRKEICARIIQRFIRCRRFRKTVDAVVAINRMHRKSNNIYQVMF